MGHGGAGAAPAALGGASAPRGAPPGGASGRPRFPCGLWAALGPGRRCCSAGKGPGAWRGSGCGSGASPAAGGVLGAESRPELKIN